MSYAIIGFGKIGHALAKAFARNGIEVSVATTRDPESFASDAAAIGSEVIPKTLAEAVKADIIFLAVRFESHPDVAKALPTWKGKTLIDVTNAYGVPPEKLGGQPSSKAVAQAFTGGRLVKGSALNDPSLDQIFRSARPPNSWVDRPVGMEKFL
jgi:8-hydroxy-5-deazaflavin:NADPH oxidoreductase